MSHFLIEPSFYISQQMLIKRASSLVISEYTPLAKVNQELAAWSFRHSIMPVWN